MKVEKKELEKSEVELTIELSVEELEPYLEKAVKKISKDVKIEGFRPGNVPYDVLKGKVGEMSILEEASRIAINETLDEAIKKNVERQAIGQPEINIRKMAPNNPMEYTAKIALLPTVELGDYKTAKVKIKEEKIDEKELSKTFDHLREMHVKEVISSEPAKDGGKVIVDIQMFLDNVPLEGGQAKETTIVLGKDNVVPGFDKNIIGLKKGESKEFKIHYPKEFHQTNLADKNIEFKISIKEVYSRELPELDDEFAKKMHFKSADDLKDNIKKNIESGKKNEAVQKAEGDILEIIVKKTKFGDLPELLVQNEGENMIKEMEQQVTQQGGKFEDYLSSLKKTRNELLLEMLPNAVKRVKASLVIRSISDKEKLNPTEKEVDEYLDSVVKQYQANSEIEKQIRSEQYRGYAVMTLANRKVIDKLKEWNLEK